MMRFVSPYLLLPSRSHFSSYTVRSSMSVSPCCFCWYCGCHPCPRGCSHAGVKRERPPPSIYAVGGRISKRRMIKNDIRKHEINILVVIKSSTLFECPMDPYSCWCLQQYVLDSRSGISTEFEMDSNSVLGYITRVAGFDFPSHVPPSTPSVPLHSNGT